LKSGASEETRTPDLLITKPQTLANQLILLAQPYLAVAEAEKRWTMRTRNWQEIMAQLSIFFQERLKDYLC
jgi:transposase-like protein